MNEKECFYLPDVQAAIRAAQVVAARAAEQGVLESTMFVAATRKARSPIELIFAAWWFGCRGLFLARGADLHAQCEVLVDDEKFILDFAIAWPIGLEGRWPKLAVELDGHDFHERTKEQVEHRDRRDRMLQRDGWKVLHFSGSELMRDPEKCVKEVWRHIDDVLIDVLNRG